MKVHALKSWFCAIKLNDKVLVLDQVNTKSLGTEKARLEMYNKCNSIDF